MSESFDVIAVGTGPAGESAVGRLQGRWPAGRGGGGRADRGECAYWACIPSKTLLRALEVRTEADRAQGVTSPELDWPDLRDYRDNMVRQLDELRPGQRLRRPGRHRRQGSRSVQWTAHSRGFRADLPGIE